MPARSGNARNWYRFLFRPQYQYSRYDLDRNMRFGGSGCYQCLEDEGAFMFVVPKWPPCRIGRLVRYRPQQQVIVLQSPRCRILENIACAPKPRQEGAPKPGHEVESITNIQAVAFQVALGAISVILAKPLGKGGALGPGFFIAPRSQLCLAVKAAFPFFLLFLLVGEGNEVPKPSDSLRAILEGRRHLNIVALCFVTAVGEELFFRGLLLGAAKSLSGCVTASLTFSSVVFGLLHARSKWYATLATVAGILLGGLYIISGSSVLAPIVVHFMYDVAVAYALRLSWKLDDIREEGASLASQAVNAMCRDRT